MNSRVILTAFLSLLLVSVSSAAAACDIFCTLQQLHPACAASAASAVEDRHTMVMSPDMPMDHEHMAGPQSSDETALVNGLIVMSPCGHEVCSQASYSSSVKSGTDRLNRGNDGIAAVRVARPQVLRTSASWIGCKSPPPGFLSIDPMSVSLRV